MCGDVLLDKRIGAATYFINFGEIWQGTNEIVTIGRPDFILGTPAIAFESYSLYSDLMQ